MSLGVDHSFFEVGLGNFQKQFLPPPQAFPSSALGGMKLPQPQSLAIHYSGESGDEGALLSPPLSFNNELKYPQNNQSRATGDEAETVHTQ